MQQQTFILSQHLLHCNRSAQLQEITQQENDQSNYSILFFLFHFNPGYM